MEIFLALLVIGTSIWVYFDAQSLGVEKGKLSGFFDLSPMGWFIGSLCVWIFMFPAYLAKRNQYKELKEKDSRVEPH
jgi:hypothetical protein